MFSPDMASIHTLYSRGNVMLPALREHFAWTDAQTVQEIQDFHRDLLDILRAKRIDYVSLRSAPRAVLALPFRPSCRAPVADTDSNADVRIAFNR